MEKIKKKNKNNYSSSNYSSVVSYQQKILILIASIVILFCVGFFWQKNSQVKINYLPNNTEIEVKKDTGDNLQPTDSVGSNEINTQLGPPKVGNIIGGGTSQDEFYKAPSTEKLLEGKGINIK